jgi:hypothetical protein
MKGKNAPLTTHQKCCAFPVKKPDNIYATAIINAIDDTHENLNNNKYIPMPAKIICNTNSILNLYNVYSEICDEINRTG